jgi:hypothetical protein
VFSGRGAHGFHNPDSIGGGLAVTMHIMPRRIILTSRYVELVRMQGLLLSPQERTYYFGRAASDDFFCRDKK